MNETVRSVAEPTGNLLYSHGLEKIYQYEVVNPATVQPLSASLSPKRAYEKVMIQSPPQQPPQLKNHEQRREKQCIEEQLTFNFGSQFAQSMAALQLEEPLESLGLSAFAYKAIASKGCKTIAELCILLPQISNPGQGFAQGHLDEISEKLRQFVGQTAFVKKTTVDFFALLRILLYKIDAKERFIFLEPYELAFLFPLKPNEIHEVEKWGPEIRHKTYDKVLQTINKGYLKEKLEVIGYALIVPWLSQRLGFAPHYELEERLIMISENRGEERLYNIKKFLEEILEIPSLFTLFLIEVSPGIYAQDRQVAKRYNQIIERAKSYFYAPYLSYPLHQLVRLIKRDCVIAWEVYPSYFIEKILHIDPYFVIWKNQKGILFIQL